MAEATLGASDQSQGPVSVSTSSIQAQLERILASPDFNVPERARTFLKYIVTETLSGRADRIKAYSIAVEVFGRDTSFDPQSDPVVRIEAGRIRRALERYYLTSGSSDPIAIAIPKGSYVPVFSSRGEELRSEQQRPVSIEPKPAPPAEASHDKWRRRTRSLAISAFAVIVVVLAAWAAFQWSVSPRKSEVGSPGLDASGPNFPKLLVEPFQDATGTAEGATIAIGLTEEVVEKLARFKDLVVVLSDPRTPDPLASSAETDSAMRYALAGSVRVVSTRPRGKILSPSSGKPFPNTVTQRMSKRDWRREALLPPSSHACHRTRAQL